MRRKVKFWAVFHFLILIVFISLSIYSNTGAINGQSVGEVSEQFESLLTPSGFVFGIWFLIYLGLLITGGFMLIRSFANSRPYKFVLKAAPALSVAHLANIFWLFTWLNELLAFSIPFLAIALLALVFAVSKLKMEKWNAPVGIMASLWWPIDLYFGWIAVAFSLNVAAYLKYQKWSFLFTEIQWTVVLILLLTCLGLFLIFSRNMREVAAVISWALIGIAARHWIYIPEIKFTALGSILILLIAGGIHAYINRKTLPLAKVKRGEIW